jgi:predicted RNase H-like HicB family nuclease
MLIQGYPVGFGVDYSRDVDPYTVYLIDIPGCGVQAENPQAALQKLQDLVPAYFQALRQQGVEVPTPSPEPGWRFERLAWLQSAAVAVGIEAEEHQSAFTEPVAA